MEEVPEKDAPPIKEPMLSDLSGVGEKMIEALTSGGFNSVQKIAESQVDDLTQIKGLGKIKAEKMIDEAKKLLKKFEK